MSSLENANSEKHYKVLILGVAIGLFGVFFRFAGETSIYSWISNITLVIGSYICIWKGVFPILK